MTSKYGVLHPKVFFGIVENPLKSGLTCKITPYLKTSKTSDNTWVCLFHGLYIIGKLSRNTFDADLVIYVTLEESLLRTIIGTKIWG